MRFVPFDELDSSPNIIVDGAPGTGTILTLSHWPNSGTPASLKRDSSTEIVFAYLDTPMAHVQAEISSNNHFDEDGLIGIFALIDPRAAEKHRDLLVDAARAGDFGMYRIRDGARIAFVLGAYADAGTTPLSQEIFAMPHPQMTGELYKRLLELLPALLRNLNGYKQLWQAEDEKLSVSEELIDKRFITIEERPYVDLAVVNIEHDRLAQSGLAECHPFALNSRTACSRMMLIDGHRVEFQYRYESWVQFMSRRPLSRVDLKDLARELNQQESSQGHWKFDGVERITPRLHLEGSPATSLSPISIQRQLEYHLTTGAPAWNPYD